MVCETRRFIVGVTLIEALCVLALITTLLALAAPSFTRLIQSYRTRQTVGEVRHALLLARSEAIRRGVSIRIRKQPSLGPLDCSGSAGNWSCGWSSFLERRDNPMAEADDEDELIHTYVPSPRISVRFTSNASVLTVNRWGAINGVAASFLVVPMGTDHDVLLDSGIGMVVCVSSAGRVRSKKGLSC